MSQSCEQCGRDAVWAWDNLGQVVYLCDDDAADKDLRDLAEAWSLGGSL